MLITDADMPPMSGAEAARRFLLSPGRGMGLGRCLGNELTASALFCHASTASKSTAPASR